MSDTLRGRYIRVAEIVNHRSQFASDREALDAISVVMWGCPSDEGAADSAPAAPLCPHCGMPGCGYTDGECVEGTVDAAPCWACKGSGVIRADGQAVNCPECNAATADESRCTAKKCGEYNPLRCARQAGHSGEHAYVVDGPAYGAASTVDGVKP